MGNKKGYQLIGDWIQKENKKYELGQIIRNDFNTEKQTLIDEIKNNLTSNILNSNKITEYTRYSLNGFYSKLDKKQLELDELAHVLSSEEDEQIVSTEIRKSAVKLKEMLKLQKEINSFIEIKVDYESYEEIKALFDKFIKETYFEHLNKTIKHDTISNDLPIKRLFHFDLNILKMLRETREMISKIYDINPKFKIDELAIKIKNDSLIEMFSSKWRSYLNEKNFTEFNANLFTKYSIFKEKIDKLTKACEQYLTYFKHAQSISIEIENAQILKDSRLEIQFEHVYHCFSKSIFKYSAHLVTSDQIADYEEKYNEFIKTVKQMNFFIEYKTIKNDELVGFVQKMNHNINFNFLLVLIKYMLTIETKTSNTKLEDKIIGTQLNYFSHLMDKNIPIDRVVNCFSSFLINFNKVTTNWENFKPFSAVHSTLNSISDKFFYFFYNAIDRELTQTKNTNLICDYIEAINDFMLNIENLKVLTENKTKKQATLEYFEQNPEMNHLSYEIIYECLNILAEIIQENKVSFSSLVGLKYFDALNELLKELDNQNQVSNLKLFKEQKVDLFNSCLRISNETDLNDYLDIIKKSILTMRNQIDISTEGALEEFQSINQFINISEFNRMYCQFDKNFNKFKELFYKTSDLNEIVKKLNEIIQRKENIKDNMIELLACLSWILTANVSKITDSNGKQKLNEKIELVPHKIQIFSCFCLLGLDRNDAFSSFEQCLESNPKKIGEILADQSKFWQVSLIALVYTLFNFNVVVVASNKYSSSHHLSKLKEYFGIMSTLLDRVKFKSLEELVDDETEEKTIQNNFANLLHKVVYKNKFFKKVLKNSSSFSKSSTKDLDPAKTLYLIDEVDTVISTEIDSYLDRTDLIYNAELAKAYKTLYEDAKFFARNILLNEQEIKQAALEKLEKSLVKNSQIASLIQNQKSVFDSFREEVWTCARNVAFYYSGIKSRKEVSLDNLSKYLDKDKRPLFRLNKEFNSWEYFTNNKWSKSTYASYYNSFFYVELFSQQDTSNQMNQEAYAYMILYSGSIYFSSLLSQKASHLLIGITNCFNSREKNESLLSKAEIDILENDLLNVKHENIMHFPSIYGESRVEFNPDSIENFRVINDRNDWIKAICEQCEKLSSENKTVIVFFKEESFIRKLFTNLAHKLPYVLTNNEISINENNQLKKNYDEFFTNDECDWINSINRLVSEHSGGQPGKINLIIREFARCIDFRCNDLIDRNGGLHVIQTWFSKDPKEEVQIKGITGRNGAPGVYMQINCLEDLREDFPEDNFENKPNYSYLREMANISRDRKCLVLKEEIEQNMEKSKKTLKWLEDNKKLVTKNKINLLDSTKFQD
jgi:hypothetical protein